MKVLIADDSQPIRDRLVDRLLHFPDVKVAEAVDTPDALRQMETFQPDVAVLDIRMPGGGGIKALTEIKKNHPSTTVMVMTSYPYAQYRRKCLDAGADFFFDKSSEFEQVAETIRLLLRPGKVKEVALRTTAAQLVAAKEQIEKIEQRQRDMSILSLLQKPDELNGFDRAYDMWGRTFDAMPDLVSILDTNHCIVRVNKAMADRLGIPAAELTGKKCFEYCHGTTCPVADCPYAVMLKDGQEHTVEQYEKHLNGCFNVSVSPIYEAGRLIGAVHIAHDITKRKEAQEAQRKSERDLRHVIGSMNDGLWDWNIINDTIKYSPQWFRLLGYEPDEHALNLNRLEELMHPDDVVVRDKALHDYFCGEAAIYNVEFRLRRKDGTYAWIWARGSLVERNAEGKPSRMMGIHSDITARREAAQAREASELRYRQLFESMQTGFALHEIICDEKGFPCDYRFLEINPAFEALTGLKEDQLIGRTVKEIMPATEPRWIELYGKVALTGEPIQIDDFSGSLGRHYSVSAYSPEKGQFATIFSDVTEQREAGEMIRQARNVAEAANLAKTQFMANMSHELRTPLNAIIGFTEILKFAKLDEEQLDYVQTIGASGEAMLSLVGDLLDFSRIELGKMEVKNQVFNLREEVGKAVALLSRQAEKKGIELTRTVEESVPETITGDPARLRQVLVNLLNNAVKFTDKGFIRLTVRGRPMPSGSRHVEFAVEDSGEGMDVAVMKRIFKPFQQGDNSNTREHGGAGLGLAISKNLVELMGGTIRVESRKGEGSLFTFDVLDQTVLKIQVEADDIREQWRGRCICVWDDDPADLRAVECLLERCGVLPRYKESIEKIQECLIHDVPADAVLCNLDMPGLAARLPEFHKIRPDVPWIAFSNWTIPPDEQVKNCFSAFIDRPLRPEQLYGALLQLSEAKT